MEINTEHFVRKVNDLWLYRQTIELLNVDHIIACSGLFWDPTIRALVRQP